MVKFDSEAQATSRAAGYDVFAVEYGRFRARKSALFYRWEAYGVPDAEVQMAYWFWVLRDAGGEAVLVDTGFDPAVGEARGRTCLCPPLDALAEMGIAPNLVSHVLVTHCHYDHIGNLAAFPNATIVLSSRELEFWFGPYADRVHFASHTDQAALAALAAANSEGRVRTLMEDEVEVLKGVTVYSIGGHSPGQLVVSVRGHEGDVLLASDAVHFYEELELERPFGVFVNLEETYRAYDRVRAITMSQNAALVPGHDPNVATQFRAAGGMAVQLA